MWSQRSVSIRTSIRYWVPAFLIAALSNAGSWALDKPEVDHTDADVVQRNYLSGNGLLNRGLYEPAAAEYRKFLKEHGDHEKAAVARYGLAVSLFRLERFDEAVAESTPLQALPDFVYAAETWTIVGQCYLALGRHADAVKAFTAVVERFAKHDLADDAAAGAIESLYADKQFDAAVKRCRDFAARWPESPLRERVQFFGGLSAMGKSDYATAAELFNQSLDRFPNGPFAGRAVFLLAQCYQQGDSIDKAIEHYRRVLQQKDGSFASDSLSALGTLLYRKGDLVGAGETLDLLIEGYPQSDLLPQARLLRGRVWFDQEKYDQATEVFTRLSGTGIGIEDQAMYWTAKCQLRLGDAAGAAGRLLKATEKFPSSPLFPEMMYDHGVALVRAGDAAGAMAALDGFQSRFAEHTLTPDALQLLALTEHQLREYDRSQAHCRTFLSRYPTHSLSASVAFLSCENDFLAEQYDEAAAGFQRFLKDRPDDLQAAKARYRLATALYRLQRFDDAELLFTELAATAKQDAVFHPVLLALGDIHFQRGDWKTAERWFREYLTTGTETPSFDDALMKLGLSVQRQERMEEAIVSYDRLIDQFPSSPHRTQALFERGQALVALRRLDEAEKAFESVLSQEGDSRFAAHALNHLAAIAAQRSDLQQAATLYARIAQSSKDAETEADALLQQGRTLMAASQFAQAEKTLGRFVERFPADPRSGEARARAAMAIARQDRHADAVAAIKQLEADSSLQLEASLRTNLYYEKAWCLRAMNKLDDATKAYRQVISQPSAGALGFHALLELAEIEAGAKQFDAAAKDLQRLRDALGTASADIPSEMAEQCTYRLGVCEYELERYDESAKLFEEFIDRFPKSILLPSASFYCADALLKTARNQQAVSHLTRVVKEHPTDPALPAALLRLGEAQAALQRWALSEEAYNAYLDRFPDGEQWYQARFGLGWARENQQRYDEAMAAYQTIVERHRGPTAARAQFQIGQCLFAQKKHEDAVRELLKVDILYSYPEWSAAALYEAARCFEQMGKTAEAKQNFQQVEEKYKQTQWAILATQRLTELSARATLPGR